MAKNTIAIFGGARRDGNTGKLIDWISEELGIEVVDLSALKLSAYDYEHKNKDDDFLGLMNRLVEYEQIIFVSPIYWYAASAQMKVFIDRTSDLLDIQEWKEIGRKLRKISAFVVCTSINKEADPTFLKAFQMTFEYFGMRYGGHLHADCENGYTQSAYEEDVAHFLRLIGNSSQ